MRVWTITLFLMSFYLALSLLTTTGLFHTMLSNPNVVRTINSTYTTLNISLNETSGGIDTYGFFTTWKYIGLGWNTLTNFISFALNFYPFMVYELSIPSFIAIIIQILIYVIYIMTFFEFVTGKSLED